jgi:DNA mismatch repair protein MutS2
MNHFLKVSNRRTLLLLDEFGTGSDPDLGGALAEVFFEELYSKKSFAVITTHYANIKLKADQLKNAINGCMLFNTDTLEPLYKFSTGQPGSSFTFEVAQINGIEVNLIEKAKTKLDANKVKMDRLLSELQKEKTYLEKLNNEHITAQKTALKAKLDFEIKKERYDLRLKNQQENLEKNNKLITLGKKLEQTIKKYQVRSRKKDINKPVIDEIIKYVALEKNKSENIKLAEKLKKEALNPKPKSKKQKAIIQKDEYERSKIKIGSTVKLISTKQSGTVEEINGELMTVTFGFMRMKVEREKLMFVK